ncbi:MAG: helix-turn-helix transcriptional regulator [Deltaproteobacteria bacterium]|jgi:putative molybdopterin biosynthesis protein|nr:helix-turn-helix transcriptional regulator [Deltaproteobacteria bacterium]
MEDQITLTAQDVADLLRIAKNTVYELVKRGELNHYRVGRKMRFSNRDVESYISRARQGASQAEDSEREVGQAPQPQSSFVICGQDPFLDALIGFLSRRPDVERPVQRSYVDSYRGLVSLYFGDVQAAAINLWDGDSNQYNVPFVRKFLPGLPAVVVRLATRVQGFYVPAGNPKDVRSWSDLKRADLSFINRDKGSGTRVLFDEQLRLQGVGSHNVIGYQREEPSHLAVAGAVSRKEADVGLGNQATAVVVEGIDFVPLQQEQYDLVFRRRDLGQPLVRTIMKILPSREFRDQLQFMRGYEVTGMGEVVAET